MKVLICLFLLSLGNLKCGVNAQTHVFREIGGDIFLKCQFNFPATWKIFCKNNCNENNLLIQTTSDTAYSGRYSIRYDTQSFSLLVSVAKLTTSDSGLYLCGVAGPSSTYSLSSFTLTVREGSVITEQNTPEYSSSSTSAVNIPQSGQSQNGRTGVLQHVGVSLLVIVVVFSALAVLIIFVKKRNHSRDSKTEEKSDGTNLESVFYENCTPADLNYESLDPDSRDHNQTYTTLT